MVLRIRLSRFGKRHDPFYNIVVSHARTARDSKPLEVLGTYDPIPQPPPPGSVSRRAFKEIKLDAARARYWIGVGAQPSDSAWRLLSMIGILEPRFRVAQIKQQVVTADNPLVAVDATRRAAEATARRAAEAAARKAKKSAAKATIPPPGMGHMGRGGTSGVVPFRAGDWKCGSDGCGYHNFAKNVSCLRCGASRTNAAIPADSGAKDSMSTQ